MAKKKAEVVSEEDKEKKQDALVKKYTGKFWKSWVFITGYGQVKGGKATEEQLEAFIVGMNPETNLDEWLSDKDEVEAYIKANTRKNATN